ncbi:MAG: hypothetical protein RIS73_897 [Bacteroidota bacterium]|jgi:hypothetical protein
MKKIVIFLLFCLSMQTLSLNASITPSVTDPLAKEKAYQQKVEMLKKISTMSVKEFEAFTGKHMNAVDRMLFKVEQRKLKNSFNEEGMVKNKKLDKYLKKSSKNGGAGFHLGGFALGFLLGLIGVLIAYLAFKDDKKKDRVKWAWIGTAVVVAIALLASL